LRVGSDAVLSAAFADKPLQSVARRDAEVLDVLRGVDQFELPEGGSLHHPINALDVLLMPDALGVLGTERPDHEAGI